MKRIKQEYLHLGFKKSVDTLFAQIEELDSMIFRYNQALERVQPLFHGKVLVKYSPRSKIKIEDDYYYDPSPHIGKMYKASKGAWTFLWVKPGVRKQRLETLRVGKGGDGDHLAIKLLRSLEEMLEKRAAIVGEIKQRKVEQSRQSQSLGFLVARKEEELAAIEPKIKVDWSKDANNLIKKRQQKQKINARENS